MSKNVLQLTGVTRSFQQAGGAPLQVLRGCNLAVNAGEMVALLGPSGSGKSTLLHIAGLLEQPTGGSIHIGDKEATRLGDRARTALRQKTVGFVYQFHHLLPEFSALENVVIPQLIAKVSKADATARAKALLDRVGLSGRETHRPARLSGGEQQRVAIARALANRPLLLLADEPTGNLDPETGEVVFSLLRELAAEEQLAAFIATHNVEMAGRMDRVVRMNEGLLT